MSLFSRRHDDDFDRRLVESVRAHLDVMREAERRAQIDASLSHLPAAAFTPHWLPTARAIEALPVTLDCCPLDWTDDAVDRWFPEED